MQSPLVSIKELISEEPLNAFKFNAFGIVYETHKDCTLKEVCKKYNLPVSRVLRVLETKQEKTTASKQDTFTIAEMATHLTQTHHKYLKQHLPFIETTLAGLASDYVELENLCTMFSDFKVRFIEHVEYEEKEVFPYIRKLQHFYSNRNLPLAAVYGVLRDFSIMEFEEKHSPVEDEFGAMRTQVNAALAHLDSDMRVQIINAELAAIEEDLCQHAKLEDEILVPRTAMIEKALLKHVDENSRWN